MMYDSFTINPILSVSVRMKEFWRIGKTVIDCSNRSSLHRKNDEKSQAEYLQSLLPKSPVVKAFNVLSAYALESGGLQGKEYIFPLPRNAFPKEGTGVKTNFFSTRKFHFLWS